MLEFAIAAPLLVLLVVGLIEFGFGFLDFQAVAGELKEVWIFSSDETGAVLDEANTTNKYIPDGEGWQCLDAGSCNWDPATRNTDLSNNVGSVNRDYLGVRVIFDHEWIVGLLPFPAPTWTDDAIMLLEPIIEDGP